MGNLVLFPVWPPRNLEKTGWLQPANRSVGRGFGSAQREIPRVGWAVFNGCGGDLQGGGSGCVAIVRRRTPCRGCGHSGRSQNPGRNWQHASLPAAPSRQSSSGRRWRKSGPRSVAQLPMPPRRQRASDIRPLLCRCVFRAKTPRLRRGSPGYSGGATSRPRHDRSSVVCAAPQGSLSPCHCAGREYWLPRTKQSCRQTRSPAATLRLVTDLSKVFLPDRFTEELVLVTRDIGRLLRGTKIENHGNIGLWLGFTQVLGNNPAHVFRKRDAEFGRLGVRAALHLGIHGDLRACIHDGAIMPSPSRWRQSTSSPVATLRLVASL